METCIMCECVSENFVAREVNQLLVQLSLVRIMVDIPNHVKLVCL